jgi:hypothetical protein
MPIDVNQDIKVWAGFTPGQFWAGAGGLFVIGIGALVLSLEHSPFLGALFLALVGGAFTFFMIYQRDLPKNYLRNRFLQEGKFFFITIPGIRGVDIYATPGSERGRRFDKEFDNHAQG